MRIDGVRMPSDRLTAGEIASSQPIAAADPASDRLTAGEIASSQPIAGEPRDDVSLQLILASGADLQIDEDPALWTAPGIARRDPRGVVEIDLGGGRVRREYPDGRVTLDGTKRLGQPVHRVRKPTGEASWQIDYPAVMASMQSDLAGVQRGEAAVEKLEGASATRFPAGPAGNQYTKLEVGDRGTFHLVSDGPLSTQVLGNMAAAIREAPARTFARIPLMFVLGELGMSRDAQGRLVGTVAGFAQYQSSTLFFTRERLESASGARETMWHEAGHLIDDRRSQTLLDEKQVPVFGYGKLIMEGDHVAVDESDFITKYASTNEQEDFAENHRALIEERVKHPELLTLSTGDLDRVLKEDGYGEPIRRRMAAIVRIYQEDVSPASPPAGASGQTPRSR